MRIISIVNQKGGTGKKDPLLVAFFEINSIKTF